MKPLILASGSPYRKALLQRLGLPFDVRPADVDESPQPGEAAPALAARLAAAKAEALLQVLSPAVVIGSDQVAELDQRILGKPGDIERARAQLRSASGKHMHFHTAVFVSDGVSKFAHSDLTTVEFRSLEDSEIDHYLQREVPFDCAGSFKAEGLGIALFDAIRSSDPTALLGLPMIWLSRTLVRMGYPVL